MKKILILLALVVCLTGCSANVNLNISSSNINEEIIINAYSDKDNSKEQINLYFREHMPVFINVPLSDTEPDFKQSGVEYYSRLKQDLGSGYKFNYRYNYKFDDYKKARSLNLGFDSKTISKNPVDKTIMISTDSSGLNYFDNYSNLESVTINISSPYKCLKNNADFVNGNTYTWVLRKGTKKGVYMVLEDPTAPGTVIPEEPSEEEKEPGKVTNIEQDIKEKNEFEKLLNDNPLVVGIVAILLFFILVLILAKVSKFKKK